MVGNLDRQFDETQTHHRTRPLSLSRDFLDEVNRDKNTCPQCPHAGILD